MNSNSGKPAHSPLERTLQQRRDSNANLTTPRDQRPRRSISMTTYDIQNLDTPSPDDPLASSLPSISCSVPHRAVQTSVGFNTDMPPSKHRLRKARHSFSTGSGNEGPFGPRFPRVCANSAKSMSCSAPELSYKTSHTTDHHQLLRTSIEEVNESGSQREVSKTIDVKEMPTNDKLYSKDVQQRYQWYVADSVERQNVPAINRKIQKFYRDQLSFQDGILMPGQIRNRKHITPSRTKALHEARLEKLETMFDKFCKSSSKDGLQTLVKQVTLEKLRNGRPSSFF